MVLNDGGLVVGAVVVTGFVVPVMPEVGPDGKDVVIVGPPDVMDGSVPGNVEGGAPVPPAT